MAVLLNFALDLSDITGELDRLEKRAADMTPLMDQIGSVLIDGANMRIGTTNVDPDGVPWEPSQRAIEDGGKTLRRDGYLATSIEAIAYPNMVEVGSNLPYAGIHQAGGTITAKDGGALTFTLPNGEFVSVGSVEIPARPYLGVSDEEQEEIQTLVAEYFRFDGGF